MYKTARPRMVRQGQIYDVDLPEGVGSVQYGTRPVVVTSANRNNRTSTTVIVAVITSQIKRLRMAEHVRLPHLPGLPKESMVCCEQRFTVDKSQLKYYRGKLPWETWKDVRRALWKSERSYKRDYESEQ